MTPDEDNIEILDAIYHDAALAEAEQGKASADDQRWARDVRSRVQARLAEMRRSLTPAVAPPKKAEPIRASLIPLARDALMAKLEAITARMGGTLQLAHRNLSRLSDDDMRRLIQTLDPDGD
jgi:hypothetical protein